MKRKLTKQTSAYVMTLPSKWIKSKNLKGGDELDVNEFEGNLLISSDTKNNKKEADITINSKDHFLVKIPIITCYCYGYDKVRLHFKEKEISEAIKKSIEENLLGFEIIEEKENLISIESVVKESEEKYNVLLNRSFFIISELFDILIQDIKENELNSKKIVGENVSKIFKYSNYLRRNLYIRKYDVPFYNDMLILLSIIKDIAKEFSNIYSYIKKDITNDELLTSYIKNTQKLFYEITRNYFSKKDIRLNNEKAEEERNEYFDMLSLLEGKKNHLLIYYCSILRKKVHKLTESLQEATLINELSEEFKNGKL
ncbi:MAG: hypothetical protein ACQER9_02570 [Nanobdellota archaeon]